MRSSPLIVWMVMALALASQAFGQIPPPYLAPSTVAARDPSSQLSLWKRRSLEISLIVTGRITEQPHRKIRWVASRSTYFTPTEGSVYGGWWSEQR